MKTEVVLCADSESVKSPELIGLGGENLLAQPWLRLFCSAAEARSYLRKAAKPQEIWVASSDDVDPINLAAALKKDSITKEVFLLTFEETGSLKSRASAAGIDGVLSRLDFAKRYARAKQEQHQGRGRLDGSVPPLRQRERDQAGTASISKLPGRPVAHSREQVSSESRCHEQSRVSVVRTNESTSKAMHVLPSVEVDRTTCGNTLEHSATKMPPVRVACGGSGIQGETVGSSAAVKSGESVHIPDPEGGTPGRSAFLLPIVSASGGAGKSTIAALSALFAQGLGYNTLLLDADMQFGDMPFLLGIENPVTLEDVRADPSRLARVCSEGSKPALLAAPQHLEQAESVVDDLPRVLDYFKPKFDIIIVNTGSFWAEQHALLLERSSRALFLVDQRPASLRAAQHAVDLCTRCGIATSPFLFAVNRCSRNATFTSIDVSCALGGARSIELRDGGKDVDELLGAGMPFELINTKNDLCVSLEHALVEVFPQKGDARSSVDIGVPLELRRFKFGKRKRRAACL